MRYLSGVVVVALMVGVGCTANQPQPSPSPPCAAPGMREAGPDERSMLSRFGILPKDREACAVDVVDRVALVSAVLSHPGNDDSEYPAMILTDGLRFAHISCDWDGSKALGVNAGQRGRDAVAATRAQFGDRICTPWIRQ